MDYQNTILSRLLDYLQLKKWKIQKRGMVVMVLCPFCKHEPKLKSYSANIIPRTSKINCFNCKKTYNLIDIVREIEPDKKDMEEEDIYQYLKTSLKLDIVTEKDQENLKDLLDFFETSKFSLVPLGRKSKRPIEKGWTEKEHKDRKEWEDWLRNNLNIAIRTGSVSNITVIDVDTKPIPEQIRKIMGNPFIQETHRGFHLIYLYEELLPKTRIDEFSIDIENNGGCIAIHPSICPIEEKGIDENGKAYCKIIGYAPRKFIGDYKLIKMPTELLNFLKERVTVPRKTISEQIAEDIKTEIYKKPLIDMNEGRNDLFVHLGGMFRKQLNPEQTEYALRVLNKVICKTELDPKEITAMMGSLERYNDFDEQELAHKVLNYLRIVEVANSRDVKEATGEKKATVDKILSYLVKEGYLIKRGRNFHVVKKVAWEEKLIAMGKPIGFKMPYFHDVAYFNWGDMLLIGSKTKYGKCFAKGTEILLYNGESKKVEDILPGDLLMGIDSKPRKVEDICVGYDNMYEIIPDENSSFTVNSEHILVLKNTLTGCIINITVKDYLKKHKTFKKFHKLIQQEVEYKDSKTELNPYFLGLWLGDGDSCSVRITNKDKEIINFLENYAKVQGLSLHKYKYGIKCPSYAIVSESRNKRNTVQESLQNLSLYNNKHIPKHYLLNSRQKRLELLAGLIDSDGYLIRTKTSYEIINKKEQLVNDIVTLARSLGFITKVNPKYIKLGKTPFKILKYFRITIKGDCSIIPTKVKRKRAIKSKKIKYNSLLRFKVIKKFKNKYYGFQVEKDKMYLLKNYIVNHNTHIAMNMVKRLVDVGIKPYYLSLETGSRFAKIALQLGLKEGDFYHAFCADPTKIELEPNSVTIIDWLLITDKAKTDLVFKHFVEQLAKTKGFLIIFQQLKDRFPQKKNPTPRDKADWFAPNMVRQFPALATMYLYDDDNDGTYGRFYIEAVREPKQIGKKIWQIPCVYDGASKELKRIDELKQNLSQAQTSMLPPTVPNNSTNQPVQNNQNPPKSKGEN
ncbi:MAG: Hint domain-containing homing endonuclease [Promethearchaeota archaeon]